METPTAGKVSAITPPPPASSKYIRDFEAIFIPIKVDELCDKACNGLLRHCQFRSLCWRYFLHCLPEQYEHWLEFCVDSRRKYEEIKAKHLTSKQLEDVEPTANKSANLIEQNNDDKPEETETTNSNSDATTNRNKELEEEQQYIKATNQCDHKTVFRTIERDVVRTFPDMEFFRQTEMQAILENVLFNFASENPQLSYKQGMHELLAILLYVLHTDSQNCLINYEGGYANDDIATFLDLKYLEHDVFQLFCALMKSIETWYQNDEILIVQASEQSSSKNENGEIFAPRSSNSNSGSGRQQVSSVLGNKLNMISHNIVKKYDLELFNHLEALQIAPQIYGIRWMRLLFGREFEFLDLLTVWDAIICDPVAAMSLTEYIFASMLVTIREELVNGDYTDCLNNLMRHQFKDVQYVIKLALHLRDPKNNPCPRPLNKQVGTHKAYSRYSPETSLTSKLSQQYISGKRRFEQQQRNQLASSNKNYHLFSTTSTNRHESNNSNDSRQTITSQPNIDQRDSRKIFMTSKPSVTNDKNLDQSNYKFGSTPNNVASLSGTRFLNPTIRSMSSNVGTNKLIPTINRFVANLGQNLQDKTQQSSMAAKMMSNHSQHGPSSSSLRGSGSGGSKVAIQNLNANQMLLAVKPVKEYEMREMLTSSSMTGSSGGIIHRGQDAKLALGSPGGMLDSRHALNLSMDTYDDLPTIVDYCWRLLSEQIDSLQRCLPKEKSLHSEDEIFVALAQLKKVRDVLKGSLKLDDELDSPPGGSKT